MSLTQDLFGTSRTIPQTGETNWDAQVTGILSDVCYSLDSFLLYQSNKGIPAPEVANSTLAASATLSPSRQWHRVQGDGAAVTLDATTAIADGGQDGQMLFLHGIHATNTVKVPDAANTQINGSVTLALGDVIGLQWDSTSSVWREMFRNN